MIEEFYVQNNKDVRAEVASIKDRVLVYGLIAVLGGNAGVDILFNQGGGNTNLKDNGDVEHRLTDLERDVKQSKEQQVTISQFLVEKAEIFKYIQDYKEMDKKEMEMCRTRITTLERNIFYLEQKLP